MSTRRRGIDAGSTRRRASGDEAVYGMAADDGTFVVTGQRLHGAGAGTVWYLLRIAPGSTAPARLLARHPHRRGGGAYEGLDIGSSCDSQAEPVNGAYLGWSNLDGSEVIGSQVCGGRSRFGIFRGGTFPPVPAPPNSLSVSPGVMDGTVTW